MEEHAQAFLLRDGFLLLGTALAFVLAFRKLGLGATLGFLTTGAVLGPYVLDLVGDPESGQGIAELGDRLGPILWQFMATKKFDPDDFGAFLKLLPASVDGVPLRHALEVRHESFDDPAFLALAQEAGAAVVFADHDEYPAIAGHDVGFSYMRLMRTQADAPTGYSAADVARWADRAKAQAKTGDVFTFFISGAKERNPAAARAMIVALQ